MVAIADVYEVTFQRGLPQTFTVPAKYAYAVVQVVFDYYVADQAQPGTSNYIPKNWGTTRFIVKGGRVFTQNDFAFDTQSGNNGTARLTIIGYLPT